MDMSGHSRLVNERDWIPAIMGLPRAWGPRLPRAGACSFLELGPWVDGFAKEPGNFGDPADLGKDTGSYDADIQTKELNNGRLAMLATMGVIAVELVTGDRVCLTSRPTVCVFECAVSRKACET
mmetsp:Transcript_135367/g.432152  ORF Transcript_135367/g.432152 Transcript_135367/m.432152 type:complete len:124 (+) Transcript_135367:825-1196(+)